MDTVLRILHAAGGLHHGLHLRIENPPYMALVIEATDESGPCGLPAISVCHYGEQNGVWEQRCYTIPTNLDALTSCTARGLNMNESAYEELCRSATSAARILQGKWRIPILCALQGGPVRLGRLVRLMPNASKKVVTENLRQLERDGVLVRTDLSDTLLHVEYDYSEGFRLGVTSVLRSLADVDDLRAREANQAKS